MRMLAVSPDPRSVQAPARSVGTARAASSAPPEAAPPLYESKKALNILAPIARGNESSQALSKSEDRLGSKWNVSTASLYGLT